MKKAEKMALYREKAKRLSNDELFHETIAQSAGDDWDGCFTKEGAMEFAEMKLELIERLESIGFLEKGGGNG